MRLVSDAYDDTEGKHLDIFNRRARGGQCFHQPCMGTREFPAHFSLISEEQENPQNNLTEKERDKDLGWMLHDIDFANNAEPKFFRAQIKQGVISVPSIHSDQAKR